MIILRTFPTILSLSKIHLLILLPTFIIFVKLSMGETILVGSNNLEKISQRMGRLRWEDDSSQNFQNCDCEHLRGRNSFRNERIFGGKPAAPGQFPYQAKIELFNFTGQNNYDHICGGVLISSSHILTAAHCLADSGIDKSSYQVVLGDKRRVYNVRDFVKHRGLHAKAQNDNDIAILKIENDEGEGVHCSWDVQPICLRGPTFSPGSRCQISGYGITEHDTLSEKLLYATVELHSHETCQRIHSGLDYDNHLRNSSFTSQHITTSMLCAGPLTSGIDACFGDSGGGLACFSKEQQLTYLTGIVSWGKSCGTKPSVYTKVPQYKDWIDMEMQLMG